MIQKNDLHHHDPHQSWSISCSLQQWQAWQRRIRKTRENHVFNRSFERWKLVQLRTRFWGWCWCFEQWWWRPKPQVCDDKSLEKAGPLIVVNLMKIKDPEALAKWVMIQVKVLTTQVIVAGSRRGFCRYSTPAAFHFFPQLDVKLLLAGGPRFPDGHHHWHRTLTTSKLFNVHNYLYKSQCWLLGLHHGGWVCESRELLQNGRQQGVYWHRPT